MQDQRLFSTHQIDATPKHQHQNPNPQEPFIAKVLVLSSSEHELSGCALTPAVVSQSTRSSSGTQQKRRYYLVTRS
jgi:hypothetical protein